MKHKIVKIWDDKECVMWVREYEKKNKWVLIKEKKYNI